MTEQNRLCPLCDEWMSAERCPKHGVPTIQRSSLEQSEEALELGSIIVDRYQVESVIGQGGMGTVYKANQLSMQRQVALKTLKRSLSTNASAMKRFYREAKSVSALDHPNIIRIFDFGVDDSTKIPFIAMEYLEGVSLKALLRIEGTLSEERSARILSSVAQALTEAHGNGIIHRDLKPENIYVRRLTDGREHIKVLDFGIAKVTSTGHDTTESLTAAGVAVGTPRYMSPEQATGSDIDFRSDLYALGCILHELLTGQTPFDGNEPVVVLMQHVQAEPPKLPETAPNGQNLSPKIRHLYEKLMAKDPAERPGSSLEVAQVLAACAGMTPMDVKAIGPLSAEYHAAQSKLSQEILMGSGTTMAGEVDLSIHTKPSETAAPTPARLVRRSLALAFAVVVCLGLWQTYEENQEASSNATGRRITAPAIEQVVEPKVPLEALLPNPIAAEPPIQKNAVQLFSSPPGAAVFRDGEPLGITPLKLEILSGAEAQTLVFRRAGYVSAERSVTAESGDIKVQLEKKPLRKKRRRSNLGKGSKDSKAEPVKAKKKEKLDIW